MEFSIESFLRTLIAIPDAILREDGVFRREIVNEFKKRDEAAQARRRTAAKLAAAAGRPAEEAAGRPAEDGDKLDEISDDDDDDPVKMVCKFLLMHV